MKAVPVVFLFCASLGLAAPLVDEPVAELHLASGKILHDAQAKGFAAKTVLVKHRDGAETVKYDQFPAEYQPQLLQKKPQPSTASSTPTPKTPAPSLAPKARAASARTRTPTVSVSSSQIGATFTKVEINNETNGPAEIPCGAVVAESSSGNILQGRHWVSVDGNGAISGTLNNVQVVPGQSTVTYHLVFPPLPAGVTLTRVFLNVKE